MAREPISIQQSIAPFSETAPADDLQVEEIGDDVHRRSRARQYC